MTGWNNLFLVAFAEIKTSKIYLCTKTWVNDLMLIPRSGGSTLMEHDTWNPSKGRQWFLSPIVVNYP